jgi:hypothetical protein
MGNCAWRREKRLERRKRPLYGYAGEFAPRAAARKRLERLEQLLYGYVREFAPRDPDKRLLIAASLAIKAFLRGTGPARMDIAAYEKGCIVDEEFALALAIHPRVVGKARPGWKAVCKALGNRNETELKKVYARWRDEIEQIDQTGKQAVFLSRLKARLARKPPPWGPSSRIVGSKRTP